MSADEERRGDEAEEPDEPRRGPAEWVTLACAFIVLAVLVGLILSQMNADDAPPSPTARVERVEPVGNERFLVSVVVDNEGGATAGNVQVQAELTLDGETATSDQTIDFLAGGDEEDLLFAFDDDPADGELVVRVTSFGLP